MTCDAKIRPFVPINDTELTCDAVHPHATDADTEHTATLHDYAFPGSMTVLAWLEADRRTFRGEWTSCPGAGCILAAGHRGACVI